MGGERKEGQRNEVGGKGGMRRGQMKGHRKERWGAKGVGRWGWERGKRGK